MLSPKVHSRLHKSLRWRNFCTNIFQNQNRCKTVVNRCDGSVLSIAKRLSKPFRAGHVISHLLVKSFQAEWKNSVFSWSGAPIKSHSISAKCATLSDIPSAEPSCPFHRYGFYTMYWLDKAKEFPSDGSSKRQVLICGLHWESHSPYHSQSSELLWASTRLVFRSSAVV